MVPVPGLRGVGLIQVVLIGLQVPLIKRDERLVGGLLSIPRALLGGLLLLRRAYLYKLLSTLLIPITAN